jgi:hypothetical protein
VDPWRQGSFAPRLDADLSSGDTALHVELPPQTLAVVSIRGEREAGIPHGTVLRVQHAPETTGWRPPPGTQWDAAAGEARFPVRDAGAAIPGSRQVFAPNELRVQASAPGHATVRGVLRHDPASGFLRADLTLPRAGSLVAQTRAAPSEKVEPRLQRWLRDEEWEDWAFPRAPRVDGAEGDLYEGLPRGLYRLRDSIRGWSSQAVEVVPDHPPATLTWDLRSTGWAEGTVILPPGIDPDDLDVVVQGAESPWSRLTRDLDGARFRIQVPGDRPVVLVPVHPSARPAAEGGTTTVTEPRRDVVLRMEAR